MNDFIAQLAPPVPLPPPAVPDLRGAALFIAVALALALLAHALLGTALRRAWRRLRLALALRRWQRHGTGDGALHAQALVELARRHGLAPDADWQRQADALRFARPAADERTRRYALARRLADAPFAEGRP